jgi:hypothetical protein
MRPRIDANIPRANQAAVAVLTALAFVLQWWPLVAVTWATIAVTRLGGHRFGVWSQLYVRIVKPRLSAPPPTEWAAPPRFAQTLGVVFLGAAWLLLAAGASTAGWILALAVTALATLASAARICVGCILYEGVAGR